MSQFDPAAFLDQSIEGTLDTKILPCPEGEFVAVIDSVNPRPWNSKDGTKAGVALDVLWAIDLKNWRCPRLGHRARAAPQRGCRPPSRMA